MHVVYSLPDGRRERLPGALERCSRLGVPLAEETMARYVPQHLFDGLVVCRLIADLAGNDDMFDDLIRRYRDAYPDDETNALVADVTAAATEGRRIVRTMPTTSERHRMAVLQGLLDIFKEDAARGKPLWRRMAENYFFNVQPTPIPDRVQTACIHLIAAQKVLLTREMELPAG
jgi:hypothetical protein